MANEAEEVLLNDPNNSEFLGFGPEDIEPRSCSSVTKKQKEANSPSFDQLLAGLTDQKIEKERQMFGFEE